MYKRRYETIAIVNPSGGADAVDKVLGRMREAIEGTEGKEIRLEDWGAVRMAFRMQKQTSGHYLYLRYLGSNTTVAELERLLGITEEAMKYQTIRLDGRVDAKAFDFEGDGQEATIFQTARVRAPAPSYDQGPGSDGAEPSTGPAEAAAEPKEAAAKPAEGAAKPEEAAAETTESAAEAKESAAESAGSQEAAAESTEVTAEAEKAPAKPKKAAAKPKKAAAKPKKADAKAKKADAKAEEGAAAEDKGEHAAEETPDGGDEA